MRFTGRQVARMLAQVDPHSAANDDEQVPAHLPGLDHLLHRPAGPLAHRVGEVHEGIVVDLGEEIDLLQ